MAQHMHHRYAKSALPDMIIPVPLHKRRLRERGFNQAQEIARICAKRLSLPLNSQQCQRDKHTSHQLGLSAIERHRNMRKAFSSKVFKPNMRIALVDDVMTTGTTFHELSSCLRNAGCEEVHLWCIARAHHE
ncbi:MAG: phosphoribosyltransferase family protein [Pseudomonadales bacterium]